VRSEVFRPDDAPKGSVNVNVQNGIVYLRGQLEDQKRIEDLVRRARGVEGVEQVESLLHTPA
jgi:osmotically-inducible protein OsmY